MQNLKLVNNNKKCKQEEVIVRELLDKISPVLQTLWGIKNKGTIQMYLDRSYTLFMLRALPIYKALLLILIFPFWCVDSKRALTSSRGLVYERAGNYYVLLNSINTSKAGQSPIEEKVFYKSASASLAFERSVCHILVGIFVSPLTLPHWLKNGFAIFCSDEILDNKYIKNESLTLFQNVVYKEIKNYASETNTEEAFAYNYVKGYWTVRYLEEEYPGFLKETFKSYKSTDVVRVIGEKLGLDTTDDEKMWIQLDEFLYNHFEHLLETE